MKSRPPAELRMIADDVKDDQAGGRTLGYVDGDGAVGLHDRGPARRGAAPRRG